MTVVSARRGLAVGLIGALGIGIAFALLPFLMGLVGAPVLAVVFSPLHQRISRHVNRAAAAAIVLIIALIVVLVPALVVAGVLVDQLPDALSQPATARIVSAIAAWHLGPFAIGGELARAGSGIASWISRELLAVVGGATRVAINLLIAFFGLYYLLMSGESAWREVIRVLPFSEPTVERLRERFHSLTSATLLGIGLTAVMQGTIVGGGFALVGLDRPLLWGVVTAAASVLPVIGSAIVWLPGTLVLLLEHRVEAAVVLTLIGAVVASNVDNIIRPVIFRRVSNIHPLVTLVGAFAGLQYFGLLGVLLGPLALACFFELGRAFEREYLDTT
jgi:predicted PurR-regulated permease PerM